MLLWGEAKIKRRVSNAELFASVSRVAQGLRAVGVQKDDRVAAYVGEKQRPADLEHRAGKTFAGMERIGLDVTAELFERRERRRRRSPSTTSTARA